ncbi:tRNA glutamyl-Q(34) synthetase GluQRS [Paracoccus sp. p4-l81]|uniref:tRNA glutamyl-Q(34) synthetase GluQRS n=1 Tax=Paracoccus sp. p4-l81 TaxID=3342806 RepID=UPI0035B7E8C5
MACDAKLRRTRFAPSPTGWLHLGHAHAALVACERADPGQFLIRIEDLDQTRSRPSYEAAIFEDLAWLGLTWQTPALRQSQNIPAYAKALERLADRGLIYPCTCRRSDIRAAAAAPNEGEPLAGPDGIVYPGTCRGAPMPADWQGRTLRLDMRKACAAVKVMPAFVEQGPIHAGVHTLSQERLINHVGDVVLWRADTGPAYHLAVVVDDAAQGITEVTRGEDLFQATQIHVLLQTLLELSTPSYWHHDLIRDETGKRLAKRDDARAIRAYRAEGLTPADLRALIGHSG